MFSGLSLFSVLPNVSSCSTHLGSIVCYSTAVEVSGQSNVLDLVLSYTS